ncbi:DUF3285 domain-containing protein [Oscillatoria sp. FACHB-1406]|uniref:DUF3285 domain-containing protein n=1 Tax=Oscillatoria sp. FACHB-1406 TaxID=2692846 RepID=UPI00168877BA|nr:DUF3285 domain-containing protein [Oscillatoria sp. FACHB-1406]MBD2577888.1 DUF3285 domain-containing protein [Oscillatoria sp. FACHB-1406]
MSNSSPSTPSSEANETTSTEGQKPPSYVKLAMRNMVRKRGTSLKHFFLSTAGILALLIGLAYLTR